MADDEDVAGPGRLDIDGGDKVLGAVDQADDLDMDPALRACVQQKLQPSVFYGWQRALFERAPQVFVDPKTTPAETVKRELGCST